MLNPDGEPPTPEEIVRHTIGLIIADALLSETGELVNNSNYAETWQRARVRDACGRLGFTRQPVC